ncbi:EF-hand domain-containing protein [Tautonia plasticadhaerens]|uniref:EF hand n=1 Tax=Tautonia plasticadhaerens TaxID=2527974 RepID=A0A518HC39_9BACT|nr:hypothetical protein [Tautonia plasticadhaerens]QDV38432.1 EF hand [Tautonia plasticadhaerens]
MTTKSMILAAAFAASGLLGTEAMAQEGRLGPGPDGPPGGRRGALERAGDRQPGGPILGALDADGDGVLSAEEIEGAPAALKAIDLDGDGSISRDDLRASRREGGRRGGPGVGGRGPGGRPGPPEGEHRGTHADRPEGGPRGPHPGPGGPPEGRGPRADGPGPGPSPMSFGTLPPFVRDRLELSEGQRKDLAELDTEVRDRLESILTPEQLDEVRRGGRGGPGGPPEVRPGRRPGGPPEGAPDRPRRPSPSRDR